MYPIITFIIIILIFYLIRLKRIRRIQNMYNVNPFLMAKIKKQRLLECNKALHFLKSNLPYQLALAISDDELELLIKNGITASDFMNYILNKVNNIDGIVLGFQFINRKKFDVKLPNNIRNRHVYIIGKTGMGKTTLLENMIAQDIKKGHGAGFIAVEYETAEKIISNIPHNRIDDVIYLNPANPQCEWTFNPLILENDEHMSLKVDQVFSILHRIIEKPSSRMEIILKQTLYALINRGKCTLLDIPKLFSDKNFRDQIIEDLFDDHSLRFWRTTFPKYLSENAHLPLEHRIDQFIGIDSPIRTVLCKSGNNINIRNAIDNGKILVFNLSDGVLGDFNSQILGKLIVAQFQLSIMSRANIQPSQRRPFHLYIDEFQKFCEITSLAEMLSRSRKYGVRLTLAHQTASQLPVQLFKQILGNINTVITFSVSQDDATRLSKEFIINLNGEFKNIPVNNILALNVGECFCKIGQHSFFMRTYKNDDSRLYYNKPSAILKIPELDVSQLNPREVF